MLLCLKGKEVKMIDEEIKIIINDILCHTKEMLKFLRSIKTGKYNAYLDDLVDFALNGGEYRE